MHSCMFRSHQSLPCSRKPASKFCVWQETGLDTVDANRALGLPDDCREYTSVTNILADLGVKSIMLMVRSCGCYLLDTHIL